MKQLFFLVAILSFAVTSISCKTKKEASTASKLNTESNTSEMDSEKTIKYRLILSFISKGAGTDRKLKEAITSYVTSHPKKPLSISLSWGREGEIDDCYLLKELNKTEQDGFIADIKKIIGTSDMVLLSINTSSNHKKR